MDEFEEDGLEGEEAPERRVGVKALTDRVGPSSVDFEDGAEAFEEKVRELVGRGVERMKAIGAVARKHPELHQAYLLATNESRTARRLIAEKYDL